VRIQRMIMRIKISSKFKSSPPKEDPCLPPACRQTGQAGSSRGKTQNYNLKVKSNVITIHEVSGQSNPYLSTASLRGAERQSNPNRSVASLRAPPKFRGTKQSPIIPSRHCESRSIGTKQSR